MNVIGLACLFSSWQLASIALKSKAGNKKANSVAFSTYDDDNDVIIDRLRPKPKKYGHLVSM